ncbi:DUF6361 family protein [Specibacter sp. NPDC078709]|uniref:DUF6361 family protein n=1 Tax=Specibacter sp. NPDC078709 TaxID=3154364 RepID=UPI0034333C44
MASLISWLDANTAETARLREIARMFETPDSIDDLALGQFRDTISNALFPGTSVLHVAARYLLLVPWCYQTASSARSPEGILRDAKAAEKQLIRRFHELNAKRFIGSTAGDGVAQLPSVAYWSALKKWGIVREDVERNAIGDATVEHAAAQRDGISERPVWHAGLPPAPEGFPRTEARGIELNRAEAEWIRDRILATVPNAMLAQLAAKPQYILKSNNRPWTDPAAQSAVGEAAVWLKHAEAFSALQHGLEALYAFLVTTELRRQLGEEPEDDDAAALNGWLADSVAQDVILMWNVEEFIELVRAANPRIQLGNIAFLTSTLDQVRSGTDPLINMMLHSMIRAREKRAKGANSRFLNKRRLHNWTAPTQVGVQTFRWTQVRNMMVDLREGLARA